MISSIIIICIFGFLSAAVDAISGGGGLISLPALLLVGIPPHLALGINKFASSMGSFNSSLTFARSGKVNFQLVKWLVPFTFLGASLGVWSVLRISPDFLNKIVPILVIFVGIYTLINKNLGIENRFNGYKTSSLLLGIVFAFSLGFYDGFFGPGTGSFLIFAFISVYGFDFVSASANSKVLNFTSNLASLILFAWNGKILYQYGIPMAIAMIIGSQVGTRLAITRGARLVKPIFLTMSFLVSLKLMIW
ncbi:putative permease [Desulfosporosinus orientis DSM 765]|uniref:Probable membrane transporter protein n=1 Tax=Desulfosporosinus orientis (strain ATCC 19365 / DSM 765 / NCIMB 8382 / VKM B-1628 / Singapore I) TaxID=768706 RepID=G7WI92_DESOD|nr:TSUP family transporter [Desulfosporosinus orientis]AET68540.1 putative permease [Desulfosporosinus orientis DSM 765]